eukprot:350149-Chlamydomonas_euryale.AAC.22
MDMSRRTRWLPCGGAAVERFKLRWLRGWFSNGLQFVSITGPFSHGRAAAKSHVGVGGAARAVNSSGSAHSRGSQASDKWAGHGFAQSHAAFFCTFTRCKSGCVCIPIPVQIFSSKQGPAFSARLTPHAAVDVTSMPDVQPVHGCNALCMQAHLELVAENLAINLRGNSLVVKVAQLGLVIDLKLFLAARRGVGDVELHGCAQRSFHHAACFCRAAPSHTAAALACAHLNRVQVQSFSSSSSLYIA